MIHINPTIAVSPYLALAINIILGIAFILLSRLNITKFFVKLWSIWGKGSFIFKLNMGIWNFIGRESIFKFIGIIWIILAIIIFSYQINLFTRVSEEQFTSILLSTLILLGVIYLLYRIYKWAR